MRDYHPRRDDAREILANRLRIGTITPEQVKALAIFGPGPARDLMPQQTRLEEGTLSGWWRCALALKEADLRLSTVGVCRKVFRRVFWDMACWAGLMEPKRLLEIGVVSADCRKLLRTWVAGHLSDYPEEPFSPLSRELAHGVWYLTSRHGLGQRTSYGRLTEWASGGGGTFLTDHIYHRFVEELMDDWHQPDEARWRPRPSPLAIPPV